MTYHSTASGASITYHFLVHNQFIYGEVVWCRQKSTAGSDRIGGASSRHTSKEMV
jgi:hypothetical protein